MANLPKFNTDNSNLIEEVLDRYAALLAGHGVRGFDRFSCRMDLCAADGMNGNDPIDWLRLLKADDFNFLHDMVGIERHMDRSTGKIGGCFSPRFARSVEAA